MPRSVRMTSADAWAVLERAHTGILTSLRRDGAPVSLPVWFVALDRRIYVAGPDHTKKFARIRNDPRVSFLVESGRLWAELVGVHLTGHARVLDDRNQLERVDAALDAKYAGFRTPHPDMPAATRAHYETQTTTIEIVPDDRILSWDNSRVLAPEPT